MGASAENRGTVAAGPTSTMARLLYRPIRHRLFGGLAEAPSTARRGRADSRSPGGRAKRAGVRDESPKGRDTIGGSMRSTTARPGKAGRSTEIRGTCNASLLKPQKHETTFTHLRKPTEPYIRKSGFVPMHESGFTRLCEAVHPCIRKPVNQQNKPNVKKPATYGGPLTCWRS